MRNQLKNFLKNKDHFDCGVVFVLIIALLAAPDISVERRVAEVQSDVPSTIPAPDSDSQTAPVSLRIPKINLETQFGVTLGIQPSGEVEVPNVYDEVGWYKHSPLPGALGPAVVLGHVDSLDGPAVFFSIGQLAAGDEIIITQADGREVTFNVEYSEKYEQAEFPTELVYGDIDHAGLRLVTCSGWYNRASGRYSHNRVVFARLQE